MAKARERIGRLLRNWGSVTEEQFREAMQVAGGARKKIGQALIDLGYATESDIAKALAAQHGMPYVDMDVPNAVSRENLTLIPQDLIKKHHILPLGEEGNTIQVLVSDPNDLQLIDDLRFRLGKNLALSLGARDKIRAYIDEFVTSGASIDEALREATIDASIDTSVDRGTSMDAQFGASIDQAGGLTGDELEDAQQQPIIKLVNEIIKEAVLSRASDIHIEPFEDRVRLRYRIDGVCQEKQKVPKRTQGSVITRLKIMAGVKVEEKRIPQDGRIKMKIAGDAVDFRVSFCPAYHGESVVLRILRPDAAKIGLSNLGMQDDTMELFNRIIRKPTGIFLVTGPTGSGKTTTLYSALGELNRPDVKIITAEDPIEYNFKGINQCQVNMNIDPPLDFQSILRAMLRQAPNIILVGEIRDKEVGEVAVQAALTGHLVFSTLHTNDAPSAITRMVDMGLKPFLVASSVQAILAQRLVRVLCDQCKEPDTDPDPKLAALCGFKPGELDGQTIYKPVGCSRCGGSGYRGRRGIYEFLEMNNELRELAFNRAPVNQLRAAAMASGMRNLLGDGRLKILSGQTTLEEISRITQVEGVVDTNDDDDLDLDAA